MKIVCDACSAKYTIPDHKLKAKQNKVRCKKCGHTIVFSAEGGTQATAAVVEPLEQPVESPAAAEGQWFAAVGGEQTGPLTKEALFALVAAGEVDQETLVWREGMEDWLRLADVQELEERPYAGGTAAFGAFEEPPPAPATGAEIELSKPEETLPPAPANDGFSAPPVATEESAVPLLGDSVIAEALATGVAPVQASDEFLRTEAPGAKAASAAAPVFADFFAPASQSQLTGSNKMVAERSEDSVLFSLATLTQSAPAVKSGAAANDASGLIDIRVLASAAAPAQAGRAPVASIAAPVIPLPPRKKNTGLLVGASVAGVAVIALAAAVFVVASRPAPTVEAPVAAPTVEVAPAAPEVAAVPAPEAPAAAPEAPAPGSGVEVAAAPEAPAPAGTPTPTADRGAPRPGAPAAAAPEAAPAAPAPEVAQAPAAPAAPAPRKPDAAVAGVLNSLRAGGAAAPAAPAAPAAAPAAPEPAAAPKTTLTKDEVRGTIARYGSRVARCKTAETAGTTVKVSFTIDPSGSVSGASSADGGEPGACVAGVVAGMKFKAFEGSAIPITFPFKL